MFCAFCYVHLQEKEVEAGWLMILLCHQTSVHDCLGEDQQLFHSQARRRGSYDKLRNPKGQPGSSSREKSFPKRENSMSGEAVTKPLHGKSACLPIRAYTSLAYLMICERSWRQDRSPWEGEREPDLHGFWSGIERGVFCLIMKLLNCSMRGRSKDFLLEGMLGWCLFCFELPDYQQKTAVDLPQWFKLQTFNLFLRTASCQL